MNAARDRVAVASWMCYPNFIPHIAVGSVIHVPTWMSVASLDPDGQQSGLQSHYPDTYSWPGVPIQNDRYQQTLVHAPDEIARYNHSVRLRTMPTHEPRFVFDVKPIYP